MNPYEQTRFWSAPLRAWKRELRSFLGPAFRDFWGELRVRAAVGDVRGLAEGFGLWLSALPIEGCPACRAAGRAGKVLAVMALDLNGRAREALGDAILERR